jgi:hypothetical protein
MLLVMVREQRATMKICVHYDVHASILIEFDCSIAWEAPLVPTWLTA